MPYLATAQAFLEQSTLLITARPTTTRITTKYNLPHPSPPPHPQRPSSLQSADDAKVKKPSKHREAKARIATLEIKCYDPVSGSCLKYKTDKGAEVGRLITGLGACGRAMTGLPPKAEEPKSEDAEGAEKEADAPKEGDKTKSAGSKEVKKEATGQGSGGGAGKKKKKGKR